VLAQERGHHVAPRDGTERAVRHTGARRLGTGDARRRGEIDPEQLGGVGREDALFDRRGERRVAEALLVRRSDLEGAEGGDLVLR
jgi:hypothetical protein